MNVQSDPPLAQSWPITPHPNQGAGWRRWQALEGPLTRYRFEWQTSFRVSHKELEWGKSLDYFDLSWILFKTAGPWKTDGSPLQQTKGAGCTYFVIFVTPLATLLCKPFRYEQRVKWDTGLFFTGSIRLCLATLWALGWCDCIITAGYRYV